MRWPQKALPSLLSVLLHIAAGSLFLQGWSAPVVSPPRSLRVTLVTLRPSEAPVQIAPASVVAIPPMATVAVAEPLTIAQPPAREELPLPEPVSTVPLPVPSSEVESQTILPPAPQTAVKRLHKRRELKNDLAAVSALPSLPEPVATVASESAGAAQSMEPPVNRAAPVELASTGQSGTVITPPGFDAAYLNNPAPAYPSAARRLGLEGTVLLRVQVSASGAPQQVEIVQSSGIALLDEAALNAVKNWSFIPARRGDEPTAAAVEVPVRFRLN